MNVFNMRWLRSLVTLVAVWGSTSVALGQLAIVTNVEPQRVFFGRAKDISVVVHNAGNRKFEGEITARMLQTSSATAVEIGAIAWKNLQVLPGQTIVASAQLDFPAVKVEAKFLVQWLAGTNRVIGTTEVWVYPTNLLAELKSVMGGDMPGVLDPQNQFKPVLDQNGPFFLDLGEMTLEDFSGRLAVIGSFQSKDQMRAGLAQAIRRIARKGVAVVWIQPPPKTQAEVKPSFYIVPEGKGAVVVVQSELVANFSENPQSQLNLIHFCKLALHPVPPTLPDLSAQP